MENTTLVPGCTVYVDGTDVSYRGVLTLTRCACCKQHLFWRSPSMAHICHDCWDDEAAYGTV